MNDLTQIDSSALTWRKSSHSGSNACIEVAVPGEAVIAVRDSKDPQSPVLAFSAEAWSAFVAAAGSGSFEA